MNKLETRAEEIGRLVSRILALAPEAGLYVSLKIEPAPKKEAPLKDPGDLGWYHP